MEYISLKNAAALLKVKGPSLHHHVQVLGLEKHKFPLDRQVYLKVSDVELIQRLRDEAAQRNKKGVA